MAGNQQMLDYAKTVSEPLFCQALCSLNADFPYKLDKIVKASKDVDCKLHADVWAEMYENNELKSDTFRFDVKDVELRNMHTGNYSLGAGTVEYYSRSKSSSRAFFAFRLNDGVSKRYNKFLVAPVSDILKKCRLTMQQSGNYLCSISDIKDSGCRYWILESDTPD